VKISQEPPIALIGKRKEKTEGDALGGELEWKARFGGDAKENSQGTGELLKVVSRGRSRKRRITENSPKWTSPLEEKKKKNKMWELAGKVLPSMGANKKNDFGWGEKGRNRASTRKKRKVP